MRDNKEGGDYLILVSALLIYISFFSGHLTTARLSILQWVPPLEIRIMTLIVAAIFSMYSYTRLYKRDWSIKISISKNIKFFSLLVGGQIFIIIFEFIGGRHESDSKMINEIFISVVQLSVLATMIFRWGEEYISDLLKISVFMGVCVGIWFLFLHSNTESGPLMSVYSVYRITLFAGFSGLYIFFEKKYKSFLKRGALVLILSIFCISVSFLTLSKAALLSGVGALLVMAVVYGLWLDKKKALIVAAVIILSLIMFIANRGQNFGVRFTEGMFGEGYSSIPLIEAVKPSIEDLQEIDSDIEKAKIKFSTQQRFAKQIACEFEKIECDDIATKIEKNFKEIIFRNYIALPDFSVRIRLARQAIIGFMENPYFGNGFNDYSLTAINLYTRKPEIYGYPHNIILELLYSIGIIGTIPVVIVFLICFGLVIRRPLGLSTALPIVGGVVSVVIGSLFGGDYSDFRLAWMFLLISYSLHLIGEQD